MRYVALLRGIGPGNPNMGNDQLRRVVTELGYRDAGTVLSSGNVLFDGDDEDAPAIEARLEAAWPDRLGFTSTTIVRSRDQIHQLVASRPFGGLADTPSSRLQVTFLKREAPPDLDVPTPADGAGYWIVGVEHGSVFSAVDLGGARTPDLMRWLERTYGKAITTRTWRTVNRIAEALG